MKRTLLALAWLFAAGGLLAAQVEVTNFFQTGRATSEMTDGGLQAAHPNLPIGSTPMIRNPATDREITVTVTGRIPVSNERIIDISADTARAIGLEPGGYVAVLFSANAGASAIPVPGGANIAIHNHVAEILGTGITVLNRIRIDYARRAAPPVQGVPLTSAVNGEVTLLLENIMFYPDSPVMRPGGSDELHRIAEILMSFPERNFLVAGHVNFGEDVEFGIWLSTERARTVANYLVDLNVQADRITVRGYGHERMIAEHTNPETWWRNRRVEITILDN